MLMNKYLKRILAIIALIAFLGLCVLTALPMTSSASTVTDAQKKQQQAQAKKNAAKTQQNAEKMKREELDKQITTLQTEIDSYQSQINTKTAQINESQEKVNQLTADLQVQNSSYNERAKMLIMKGNVPYLEIILKSKSIDDFLTRVSVIKQVAKYDSTKLQEIKDSMAQVEQMKNELLQQKASVVALKEQVDSKKDTLDVYRAQSQKIIDKLQSDIDTAEKEYQAAKKAEDAARAAAEEARKRAESAASKGSGGSVVAPAKFVGGQFMWPSATYTVTSPYGYRINPVSHKNRLHAGVDIGAPYGTSIFAANSGTVIVAGYNAGGYGNYVVISHGGGYSTLYGHASSLCVSVGQQVSKGQVIARCGSTGASTGPHVHFEIHVNGSTVNPMSYFR